MDNVTDNIARGERVDRINDDITLIQLSDGLTFTTDAYLLSAYVRRPAGKHVTAVELGAGTGVVSLLAAARKRADVITAVEAQEKFVSIMHRNVELNELSDAVRPLLADVRDVKAGELGTFDFVFSNPPYMRAGSGYENVSGEKNMARREVMGTIYDFCAAAGRLCRYGGMFYVVYRPDRLAELCSALRDNGFEPKSMTFMSADADSAPSLLFCASKRGSAPGMKVTTPLFVYECGTRTETEDFKRIYETGSFPDKFTVR